MNMKNYIRKLELRQVFVQSALKTSKAIMIPILIALVLIWGSTASAADTPPNMELALDQTTVSVSQIIPEANGVRGSDSNMAIVNNETPTDAASLKWSYQVSQAGSSWGADPSSGPIIVGDYIYSVGSNTLYKFNIISGSVAASAALTNDIDSTYFLTAGGDMLFVQETGGIVEAFDLNTLDSRWRSSTVSIGTQGLSPVYFYNDGINGYVFAGTTNANNSAGTYYCLNAETGAVVWSFAPDGVGFYWAGSVVVNNAVIFGSSDGLYSVPISSTGVIASGSLSDNLSVNGQIRSSVAYDNNSGNIYFTTNSGYVYSVPVESNGTFGTAVSVQFASASTSTPLVYDGKVFVGATSDAGLYVLDANNLSEIASVSLSGGVQSAPLLSKAYESTRKLYIYITCNAPPGGITVAAYDTTLNTLTSSELFTPTGDLANYCIHSVICDGEGILYYQNDSGYLMAVENSAYDPAFPTITLDTVERISDSEAVIDFTASESGSYYYIVVESSSDEPIIDMTGDGTSCNAGENTLNLTDLSTGAKDVYIKLKDSDSNISNALKIVVPKYSGSDAMSVTLRVEGISDNFYYDTLDIPYTDTLTVQDALLYIDEIDDNITFTGVDSAYITAVNNETASTFGGWDSWLYRVNNIAPAVGINQYALNSGDAVLVYYSDEYGTGMQFPEADSSNLSNGVLKFTSSDTTYDEQWNPTIVNNPITGATVTWYHNRGAKFYTTDTNGEIRIDSTYLTPGIHRIQIEKYADTEVNGQYLPLVLRLAPDYTVTVAGSSGGNSGNTSYVTVTFTLMDVDSAFSKSVEAESGSTVYDIFIKVMNEQDIDYVLDNGNYVKSIDGLTEGDAGDNSGWMYTVNGTHPAVGITDYAVKSNDVIVFHFSDDYTQEGAFVNLSPDPVIISPELKDVSELVIIDETVSPQCTFTDVETDAWYYDAVKFVIDNGLFIGTGPTTFEPETPMTRAMFVSILARVSHADLSTISSSTFNDIDINSWYGPSVIWAKANGIADGYSSELFVPDDEITREQMCSLLVRYAEYAGIKLTSAEAGIVFDDAGSISNWAYEDVLTARQAQLIAGKGHNLFDPQGIATRAEAAMVFMRFVQIFIK